MDDYDPYRWRPVVEEPAVHSEYLGFKSEAEVVQRGRGYLQRTMREFPYGKVLKWRRKCDFVGKEYLEFYFERVEE